MVGRWPALGSSSDGHLGVHGRHLQSGQYTKPRRVAIVEPQLEHVGDVTSLNSTSPLSSTSDPSSASSSSDLPMGSLKWTIALTACGFPSPDVDRSKVTLTGPVVDLGAFSLSFVLILWPIQKLGTVPTKCFACKKISLPSESLSMKPQPLSALNMRIVPERPSLMMEPPATGPLAAPRSRGGLRRRFRLPLPAVEGPLAIMPKAASARQRGART
mmetsp:Transcript_13754/g.31166  ORF Transcript_13754/g.31166 Transcript_13754/m.31166 type:complete len:215 (-) Transcript_13754:47-691(-)